ncbi:hypothetical protein N0V90_005820 [Kalmusia sp. IMI 367209]|nr:hypothetical protein N0V90_005820 [Kalmusia sp. IMI 367209]
MVKGPETRITTKINLTKFMNDYSSSNMDFFKDLFDSGKVHAHKSDHFTKAWKERGYTDVPNIGRKMSPFWVDQNPPNYGTLDDVKNILQDDLRKAPGGGARHFSMTWGAEEPNSIANGNAAALELVNNIENPRFTGPGYISNLPSQMLDQLAAKKNIPGKGVMMEQPITCSVFPCDTLLTVEHHNETTSYSALLTGEILWVIWPPTQHNLATLQQAYNNFAQGKIRNLFDVREELEGGVMLGQLAGEGLRLPPHCIMAGVVAKTSVLASYSFLTVANLMHSLTNAGLHSSWMDTELDGDHYRAAYSRGLARLIERILSEEFEDYPPGRFFENRDTPGPLRELARIWDQVSNDIAAISEPVGADKIRQLWVEFLVRFGRCAICDDLLENNVRDAGPHFDEKHWPQDTPRVHFDPSDAPVSASHEMPIVRDQAGIDLGGLSVQAPIGMSSAIAEESGRAVNDPTDATNRSALFSPYAQTGMGITTGQTVNPYMHSFPGTSAGAEQANTIIDELIDPAILGPPDDSVVTEAGTVAGGPMEMDQGSI